MAWNIGLADIKLFEQGGEKLTRMKSCCRNVFRLGWRRTPLSVHAQRSWAGCSFRPIVCFGWLRWRVLLIRADECVCRFMVRGSLRIVDAKLGQFLPEKFSAIDHLSRAHVKQIYRQHAVFVVIAEYIRIVTLCGRNPLALLQLLDGRDQIAVACGTFVLLQSRRLLHARAQ